MRHELICVALSLAACSLKVDYTGTLYACGPDGACPDHYTCLEQRCVPTTPETEAPVTACTMATAASGDQSCAVRDDGTAWCWGRNDFGQLGDGTVIDH